MEEPFIIVPTWEKEIWTLTTFNTRQDFINFLLPLFKIPGEYKFDETTLVWKAEAEKYHRIDYYCLAKQGSKDYRTYWDDQKYKCRYGAIYKANGKTWYLPREYYMWLNFLPIFDKVKRRFDFPEVWDTQYHLALYELLAELHYKHAAVFKKRQIASSYYHAAKMINLVWFEEGVVCKMGSSLKDKINEKGTWKFLNEYKSFLDSKTAWYRPMNPGKPLMWQQQIQEEINGRPESIGLKGTIQGLTLEKDPTSGVGGDCRFFFYEEGGIAPSADKTKEYLLPAMKQGEIYTGIFVIAGSVGELDQCKPLEAMVKNPVVNDIYPVETNLLDDKGTVGLSGLFIPEQWSRRPYIDKWGNSLVEEALASMEVIRAQEKKNLEPALYQLRISQEPRNIAEGFAYREIPTFPMHLLMAQKRRIEEKTYPYEFIELSRDASGKVIFKVTSKLPISEFPISKKTEDKTGVLVVWEKPDPNAEWGTYYASVDPVSEGKTTTSDSLCSIYVYKNPVEVTRRDGDKIENFIEGDKIVASWTGRFDDLEETHKRLEMIIEWYNAWTIVENNISQFIIYMIERKKQKYIVTKDQITFLKDLGSNSNVYQAYGWRNTGRLFKDHLLSYLIQFLKEEIYHETKENGDIVKTIYGIERIPDPMAIAEMEAYQEGLNVDRLVSLAALIAFAKVQQANRGYKKRFETTDKKHLEKTKEMYILNKGDLMFRHVGGKTNSLSSKPPRSAFRNLK